MSVFTGTGTLTAFAKAGPDLDALWDSYQATAAHAALSLAAWNETAIAGGTSNQTGMGYTRAYEDQLAAGTAYQAWLDAFDAGRAQ
jgi:choline dehydrogenase-like flavoprotein